MHDGQFNIVGLVGYFVGHNNNGYYYAPLQRDGHRVKNSCGIPTVNFDLLTQFIEANDLIPMNGYLRQKTNQLPTFRGPNERVTRLDWILSKNMDKSHIMLSLTLSCPLGTILI